MAIVSAPPFFLGMPSDARAGTIAQVARGRFSLAVAVGNQLLTYSQADFRGLGLQVVEALQQQASGTSPGRHQIERTGSTLVLGTTTAAPRPQTQLQ